MITSKYKNIVLEKLRSVDVSVINPTATIPVKKGHPNYDKMVETVKLIIDWEEDIANGFILEFNSDFTIIRKRNNDFLKPKQ